MAAEKPLSPTETVFQKFRAGHFDEAADVAEWLVREAVGRGDREVLRALADEVTSSPWLRPVFARVQDAAGADAFYARLADVLEAALGSGDSSVAAAKRSLATTVAFQSGSAEAARKAEEAYQAALAQFDPYDSRVQIARDNLAIQYRNLGQGDRAAALYAGLDVCEHLQAVKDYLLAQGGTVHSVGSPWGRNCRRWMYFNGIVIDADALRRRFALPDFVVTHAHLGTHEGHEQGLVCERHHDALMGPHPRMAPVEAKVVG
jgi:hypothetical protein